MEGAAGPRIVTDPALPPPAGPSSPMPPPPSGPPQLPGGPQLALPVPGTGNPAIPMGPPIAGQLPVPGTGSPAIPMSGRTVPRIGTDRGNVGAQQQTQSQRQRAIAQELLNNNRQRYSTGGSM